ncbi:hypothetical protein HYG87_10680 [Methanobacterium alkalithermotolerans]|uniref:Uncharacterized protein n=1 Tax=Methanobacterium alkalithermotolerans TaxID=2731220 RepID=A0A8T8K6C5_9EURY|nr:hypothetical protein [Methanobacterium alkalithermotolerans]QUH24188.1 hypothetical protein HYG87_10680 [Methanobacterium alkalithermotolerans]
MTPQKTLFDNLSNNRILRKNPAPRLKWTLLLPGFKRFVLIHLLKVGDEYDKPGNGFTLEILINTLKKSMGDIVPAQTELIVESLIAEGYIHATSAEDIRISDKVSYELKRLDDIIFSRGGRR